MCGIAGFTGPADQRLLKRMLGTIAHRGPDAEGFYVDDRVNLGNRRLAVIDVEGGDQPIANETGDVVVVYNGEIYNFRELRDELQEQGHQFATATDTEVLVHLYEEHGDTFVAKLNGMFAFALWDQRRHRLLLARDQVGIKPLCYWSNGRELVFASEIKAILAHPRVTAERDPDATHLLLNLRFVPGPATLFRGIYKLPPGHLLTWDDRGVQTRRYWDWDTTPDESVTGEEWSERFRTTLSGAVRRQLVSDVPIGAFLSGGLDSSTLVAMAAESTDRLTTFCLGFNEPTDEMRDARLVAEHFGTNHFEDTLDANPLSVYPRVIHHVEEPKVNAVQGYFVSAMARRHVTVALSGMGGDELFVGYDIHRHLNVLRRASAMVPGWAGRLLGPLMMSARRPLEKILGPPFENYRRGLELAAHLRDPATCYSVLRNGWDLDHSALQKVYSDPMIASVTARTSDVLAPYFSDHRQIVSSALAAEFNLKMVDDFLHNEDRVSMAHSLELRMPFLDREVVAEALRIPLRHRFPRGQSKAILKQAMRGRLPEAILRKPKWGFSFNPYLQFQKDLGSLAASVLTRKTVEQMGIFRYEFLEQILQRRPHRGMRWHYFMLWMALGFHYWHEIFIEGRDHHELVPAARAIA